MIRLLIIAILLALLLLLPQSVQGTAPSFESHLTVYTPRLTQHVKTVHAAPYYSPLYLPQIGMTQ
jgi:hypothetical protein